MGRIVLNSSACSANHSPISFYRAAHRRNIGKEPIDRDLLKLAFRVLVEAAHPDVADALTWQGVPPASNLSRKSIT